MDISRQKYKKQVENELKEAGLSYNSKQVDEIAEIRVRDEIKRGVQMIQYQVITLMTTNGQAPFRQCIHVS